MLKDRVANLSEARKLAFIACIYGYPNFATTLLSEFNDTESVKSLQKLFQPFTVMGFKLLSCFWPELHQ